MCAKKESDYQNSAPFQLVDQRSEAIRLARMRETVQKSKRVEQLRAFQEGIGISKSVSHLEDPARNGLQRRSTRIGEHEVATTEDDRSDPLRDVFDRSSGGEPIPGSKQIVQRMTGEALATLEAEWIPKIDKDDNVTVYNTVTEFIEKAMKTKPILVSGRDVKIKAKEYPNAPQKADATDAKKEDDVKPELEKWTDTETSEIQSKYGASLEKLTALTQLLDRNESDDIVLPQPKDREQAQSKALEAVLLSMKLTDFLDRELQFSDIAKAANSPNPNLGGAQEILVQIAKCKVAAGIGKQCAQWHRAAQKAIAPEKKNDVYIVSADYRVAAGLEASAMKVPLRQIRNISGTLFPYLIGTKQLSNLRTNTGQSASPGYHWHVDGMGSLNAVFDLSLTSYYGCVNGHIDKQNPTAVTAANRLYQQAQDDSPRNFCYHAGKWITW